jgi:hypothetical protein
MRHFRRSALLVVLGASLARPSPWCSESAGARALKQRLEAAEGR